jgi:GTP 3',8-cyclase
MSEPNLRQQQGSRAFIPIVEERSLSTDDQGPLSAAVALPLPSSGMAGTGLLTDMLGRALRDLRISVTDRCNFRCSYCMPKEVFDKDYPYLPQKDLLTFEEIVRLAGVFAAHGVQKVRLTGGEPLLRKNIEELIARLAGLRTVDGQMLDLTLTTNGSLLRRKAKVLKEAGLQRVTVSLDGLDDRVFRAMNDVDFPVADVLDGIEAAKEVGLGLDQHGAWSGLKVNMVVKKGTNDQEILPMARHFKTMGVTLRFIEYMDVGATNGWRMDEVMPSQQIVSRIHAAMPLVKLPPRALGETAERWGFAGADGQHDSTLGEIGMISSVTQAFCGECNRARLSTDGKLYTCLFGSRGHDLRSLVRGGASQAELESAVAALWSRRTDRYSELRGRADTASVDAAASERSRRVEMSYIGG